MEPRSKSSEHLSIGPPDTARFLRTYDEYFADLDDYLVHYERLIALYSGGEGHDGLLAAFDRVVEKVRQYQSRLIAEDGADAMAFGHGGEYAGLFYKALVLLSFGLCLRAPRSSMELIAGNVERGDPLIETLVAAAAPGVEQPAGPPAFRERFEDLYNCLAEDASLRTRSLEQYLDSWYQKAIDEFAMKDMHLEADPLHYVGYWSFEAAGIVSALHIPDQSFAGHIFYPVDLGRMRTAGEDAQ